MEIHKLWRSAEKIHKPRGLIFIEMEDGLTRFSFYEVRAGLVWPEKGSPAYYTIIGQSADENVRGRKPLIFLDEGQSDNLGELFDRFVHTCLRLYCTEIYTDINPPVKGVESGGFEDLYDHYLRENRISGPFLRNAPYRGEFEAGLSFIRKWLSDRALELPVDTIVREQLAKLPKGDLGGDPGIQYWAVRALCYVVGSFEREGTEKRMTPADCERLRNLYGSGAGIKGPLGE